MEDISNLSFKRRLEVNDFVEIIACAPSPTYYIYARGNLHD